VRVELEPFGASVPRGAQLLLTIEFRDEVTPLNAPAIRGEVGDEDLPAAGSDELRRLHRDELDAFDQTVEAKSLQERTASDGDDVVSLRRKRLQRAGRSRGPIGSSRADEATEAGTHSSEDNEPAGMREPHAAEYSAAHETH